MNRQMVMNAEQAAELTAILKPRGVVPIHYRYTATFPRTLLIEHERNPDAFVRSVEQKAPGTDARVLTPESRSSSVGSEPDDPQEGR